MASYADCKHVTNNCPVSATAFGYKPSLPGNAILLSVFSLVIVAQLIQGIGWKTWGFMTAFVLGAISEVTGYAGRLVLHYNPWRSYGFVLQMYCLTIAPIFFSAGLYLCYSRLVKSYNKSFSRINPDIYPMISAACCTIPFVLQLSGAAIISNNIQKDQSLTRGVNLIIAGLSFQILTLVLFGILCVEYAIRAHRQPELLDQTRLGTRSTKRFRYFWLATSFSAVLVLTRCIYLVAALLGRWARVLRQSEVEFLVFDGMMIATAGYALSIVHPGYVFQRAPEFMEKDFKELTDE